MRLALLFCLVMLLAACSSTPRYNSYANTYVPPVKPAYKPQAYQAPIKNTYPNKNTYTSTYSQQKNIQQMAAALGATTASPTKPVVASPQYERLTYEDLVRFEPNCEKGTEQVALLEEQLRRSRFYTVDGVEGNTYPGKISKSYYSLAKYRIWSLRFACQGSEVSRDFIKADLQASPNLPPTSTPRCYFEETTEAKTGFQQTNYLASDHKSSRKEICTNFPYVDEKPFIRVGDQMSMSPRQLVSGVSNSALRKWKGNVYQLVSKTEIHFNQAVRFTLVTVRSGVNQWTVVDKF